MRFGLLGITFVFIVSFLSLDFHEFWQSVMTICLFNKVKRHVSAGMGDRFCVLLQSLMGLRLALVDRNHFRSCFSYL